jgi:alpha-1,2-mannosyltransferase
VLLGVVLLVASAWPAIDHYFLSYPDEIWQVDLEVYREGADSLVGGRQVYEWLTGNPQYLPFTYPPFAALSMTPLLLVSFRAAGWLWLVLQLGLLWVCTGLAFRPFLDRFGARRGVVQGLLAALLLQLRPVQDGVGYGQINGVIVTLCLVDLTRARARSWPRGSLIGLATAIKLTPAVFWLHFAVTRQWRTLVASVGFAAAVTAITALISPSASAAYWTDALLDPGRLGPNAGTANQSLRGMLMRLGPGAPAAQSLIWLLLVLLVGGFGLWLAARLDRIGDPVAVVAVLGMVAVLISPVSWVHHLQWGIVVIGALLGDGRRVRRVVLAAAASTVLLLELPWWGASWQRQDGWLHYAGNVAQQSYCWFALLCLPALWWVSARRPPRSGRFGTGDRPRAADRTSPGGTGGGQGLYVWEK